MQVLKVGLSIGDQNFLKRIDVKKGREFIADGTANLVVGYGTVRVYHNSTKHLIVDVAVEIFHQQPVGESGVGFQYHKGNLCRRRKTALAP